MPARLSYAGTPITPERTKAAPEACDRALARLAKVFANAPKPPAHIKYDLVVYENGEYRWAQNDVDLMIPQGRRLRRQEPARINDKKVRRPCGARRFRSAPAASSMRSDAGSSRRAQARSRRAPHRTVQAGRGG